jgi:hypothetical protein
LVWANWLFGGVTSADGLPDALVPLFKYLPLKKRN